MYDKIASVNKHRAYSMNTQEEKRARELSKAVIALSNGIKAKEVKQKPKNLDFLNLPKPQKPKVIDAKKNLDYLQKLTGLPIPKKEAPKEKDLKFVDKLKGISHSEITQDVLVDRLHQKIQPQVEAIKADFLNEIGLLRSEALQKEADKLVISDELVKVFLQKLKNLPENEKLDVTDLRNFQSFIFGHKRYDIEELLHGGGNGKGLDILVNGADKGILEDLNFVAGANMTITYSTPGGVPTITFNASGGGPTTTALAVSDLSSQANGTNKVFNIPANSAVLEVIGSDAPFIYRQNVDYTVSGTTLTFDPSVPAPSAGSTLLEEYTPASVTPTTAFYDLSPFTDGLTQVFSVPSSISTLSLRGSDFPFIYEQNVDFTVVGNILNLFTANAPSAGSTLIWDYTSSFPSATTVDLTPQVNGTNMVFNIPTITSAIALTGTDAPIVYRQGIDYIISGTSLVLLGVHPPSGTLQLLYV